jgi:capsular exopolysaccharide synthesis family protein
MSDDSYSEDTVPAGNSHVGAMVAVTNRLPQVQVPSWSYGPPPTPEIINAKPGPVELLHALRRRWMLATGLGLLVGGGLAALVWFLMPVKYEVMATLRVSATRQHVLGKSAGSQETDFQTYKRTQAALLKSSFVMQATLRKPELKRLATIQEHQDELVDWLTNEIMVDFPGDAEIMRVAMKGDRPNDLKVIVNAVKDSYLDEIVNAERLERLRQRDLLERLYKRKKQEIRDRIQSLYKLNNELNTLDSPAALLDREMAMKQLNATWTEQNTLQQRIKELDIKILIAKARIDNHSELELPEFLIEQQISSDPEVAQLKETLAQISQYMTEEQRRVAAPNAPSLVRVRQQAQMLEEQLEERRSVLRPGLIESIKYSESRGEDPAKMLPLFEAERKELLAGADAVNASLQKQLKDLQEMNKFTGEIELGMADLNELKQITERMATELNLFTVEVDENARPRVVSIEDATAPSGNDAVRKYVSVGFVGVTGFAAVLFGIAVLEFQSRRVNSERDLREGLGIRVIGHLPSLSGRSWRKIADGSSKAGAYLQSLLAESVDSIRATLVHSNGANPPRLVMVSSADTQEGKTTVASQLAASLARSGRRTLLLDGDLRNPSAHTVFGLPLGPGFAEVLRNDAEREAAVYPTPAQNLWLMPAGNYDASTAQAFSGDALVSLVKSLKVQYDFVIVDAPPVLKVADPLIFGQCVDAAVLSVRRDVSQIPKVYEACERLKVVGVNVLGVIVNGVNEKPMKRSAPMHL